MKTELHQRPHVLLSPSEIHWPGDEMYIGEKWVPVPQIHFGQLVGEGAPCRRRSAKKPPAAKFL